MIYRLDLSGLEDFDGVVIDDYDGEVWLCGKPVRGFCIEVCYGVLEPYAIGETADVEVLFFSLSIVELHNGVGYLSATNVVFADDRDDGFLGGAVEPGREVFELVNDRIVVADGEFAELSIGVV